LPDGIGHISRVAGATNLDPTAAAEIGNAIQRFLVEETRLGIPAFLHEETLHGLLARDAPVYQQSIGAGAAFDPALVEAIGVAIRRRMRAIGGDRRTRAGPRPFARSALGPRRGDLRRDPYMAAALGSAYVRGLQGRDPEEGVAATAKHFVGHGLAEGGLNQAPAHVGPRELRDEQLLPFEAVVRGAGIAGVMPAYCDVDGVPCHASRELLTAILREEWGFDGVVASDYTAVGMLVGEHRLTSDYGTAAAMSLRAGMDNELPTTFAYGEPLRQAIADGGSTSTSVDLAVERTLRLKFRLGLFDRPYVTPPTSEALAELDADDGHSPWTSPAGRSSSSRTTASCR
jgi:beta-glucosidase